MDAYSLEHKCRDFSKHNDKSYFNTIVEFVVVLLIAFIKFYE